MRAQSPNTAKLAVLILFSTVILLPLYVPLLNSFKTMEGFFSSPFSVPDKLELNNYVQAWVKGNLFRFLINSIIVTSTSVLLVIFLSSMVAFVLSRRKTLRTLNRVLFIFFLMGIMIPPQVGIIPLYLQMKTFHLSNTLLGLIIVFSAYQRSQ